MVFAAGLGTRLRPLTTELPKPAVPVANRPLAVFALDALARAGVREIVINTHHLGPALEAHLRPWLSPGTRVHFEHEPKLLGTGGGLRNVRSRLVDGEEPILVINGDILFAPEFARAIDHHRKTGAVATMIVREDPRAERFGAVEADAQGIVRRLLGAPEAGGGVGTLSTYMFTGAHVLSPRAFDALPEEGCIVRGAYRRWVDGADRVAAYVEASPWRDLGTVEEYWQANVDLAAGRAQWPGIEPSGDGILAPSAQLGRGVRVTGSVIGEGVILDDGAEVVDSVVWPGVRIGGVVRSEVVAPSFRLAMGAAPRQI